MGLKTSAFGPAFLALTQMTSGKGQMKRENSEDGRLKNRLSSFHIDTSGWETN